MGDEDDDNGGCHLGKGMVDQERGFLFPGHFSLAFVPRFFLTTRVVPPALARSRNVSVGRSVRMYAVWHPGDSVRMFASVDCTWGHLPGGMCCWRLWAEGGSYCQ